MSTIKISKRPMKRRDFLGKAGRVGAGAFMASISLINNCKNNPSGPDISGPVNLNFRVYNHTQGFQTEFSERNVMSGRRRILNVSDIIAKYGINNVDEKRIALRKANLGTLIQYSKTGIVEFEVPKQDADYDIFLFDAGASMLYERMETS